MNATQTHGVVYDALNLSGLLGIGTASAFTGFQPNPIPGFVTFFDPGVSISLLRRLVAKKGTIFYPQSWYDNKPFDEQQALLPTDEEIPSARVVVMGVVIHYLATGERLFPGCWVRCTDPDTVDVHVCVGNSDHGGLCVDGRWDGNRVCDIGLASCRKF
jgi:hypothetical protein